MKTSARLSLLPSLLLWGAACNGATPPATTSGEPSGTAGGTAAASNGPGGGTSSSSTSAGQNNTTGSASGGSSSGNASGTSSGSGTAAASTAATSGSTGGTTVGMATGTGTGSGGKGSSTGGSTSGGATCQPACAGKLTCCGDTCVDLTGDSFNCGKCGKLCPESQYCSNSSCVDAKCPTDGCNGTGCCGGRCCDANQVCCFDNGVVAIYLCEDLDAGSCPISCAPTCVSRRDAKRDIEYLDEAQLQSAEAQVLKIPLARFNYKWDSPTERRRLGFIIDDVAPSPGVIDEARGEVDLYGYTSLAVAALQEQGKEIARLRKQVDELQKRLDHAPRPKK